MAIPLGDLEKRIKAIEARQRDHNMHDPDCPIRRYQKHDARGMTASVRTKSCNCWLEPAPTIFKITIGDGSSYVFNITHQQGSQALYLGKRELKVTVVDLNKPGHTPANLLDTSYGPRLEHMDLQTIQLSFPQSSDPPPSNSIEVTVISKEKQ
jgi:hypothetical protein